MATTGEPSSASIASSSSEIIEKCKQDISALCTSIVQLRLHDRPSIDVLQRDTDWMHSVSLLALLFRVGPAQPPEPPTVTLEGLAAEVRRLAERCDLMDGRQNGSGSSAPAGPQAAEQSTSSQQPPIYEEVGSDQVSIFIAPQLGLSTSHSGSIQSMAASSSTSAFLSMHERTYFYIHTRIHPPFVPLSFSLRGQIRGVVDPRGLGMRVLELPKFHLLSTGEIIIILEDEEAATRAKNRLTAKLPAILRRAYIIRWPGTPTPYLVFKITSIIPTPSTTPAFRQMLREGGVARKQFLSAKIMENFPILRLYTPEHIPDEERFLADGEILVLVLEGSTPPFAQDFATMNPRIGIEGLTMAVSASVASDVPNWRDSIVDWNVE